MHELSIAESVVRIAERHADGRRVASVEVRVGALRQVVPSALDFAFGLVAQGTTVEGAELAIEDVPAAVACRDCAAENEVSGFPWRCPSCGGLDVDVIRGEELQVESLELEDQLATSGGMDHGD
jgi:hydrogenase nickel incorporation protein HypA/HybF